MIYDDITGFWIPETEEPEIEYDDMTGFKLDASQYPLSD